MGADQHNNWQTLAASALEWWADAGVDTIVEDTVRDWSVRPPAVAATAAVVAQAAPPTFPNTLDTFLAWRIGDAAPERGWRSPIVAGEGDPASAVMVLLDHPTGDRMLPDAEGRLFDRMLAAIGLARGDVYVTALALAEPLARAIPAEDLPALVALSEHLIGLSGAQHVLILSQSASRAMLGTDRANARPALHGINHGGRKVDMIASMHPRFLLERPAYKRDVWKDLQLLLGGRK